MVYILLTALFLILATFFFTKLLKSNLNLGLYNSRREPTLPPVEKAWPLVGAIYMLIKDPLNLIKKNYQKHGSVFTIKVLGQNVTMLIGPEVSSHFYTAPESELSLAVLLDKLVVSMFGQNVAYGGPAEIRRQQFQFLKKGLSPQKLRYYVGQTLEEAQDYLSKWQDCGTVDLMHELQCLITLTCARCMFGYNVRENLSEDVSSLICELGGGLSPISILWPNFPIPAHYRRDRAKAKLNDIFSNIINSRKSSLWSEEDLLQTLIESVYTDGKYNTNEQVVGIATAILFASKHSAGMTAVWTAAYLLQSKAYFSKVLEEQKELLHRHGSKIDFDILGEMDVLHRCIKEAIRLGSTAIITARYCRKAFTVTTKEGKEYMVPKGHIVATPPTIANRLDYVYKDPERYDPDRYLSIEEKEMASRPFSNVSFGGGRHLCPGEAFAYINLKTIWSYLLRNFELELASSFPEGKWNGKEKLLVRYKRRKLSI
ncbi:sterol 14-demethylase [Carex littledalei]|uniref:Sterol 14-demethylase n=1 Tax=Carex littledalei TaxID=544730 RepID=A0A833QTI9_9POAL|nr:sterol 14-demethylase [Carex littledalei]